jgi:hypothetical protein
MAHIIVHMKDGTKQDYPETFCAGGSYRTTVRYEGCFAVIEDAIGNQTAIPSMDIAKIDIENARRSW